MYSHAEETMVAGCIHTVESLHFRFLVFNDRSSLDSFLECITEFELELFLIVFSHDSNRVSLALGARLVASFTQRTGFSFLDVKVKDERTALSAGFATLNRLAFTSLSGRTNDEIGILVIFNPS